MQVEKYEDFVNKCAEKEANCFDKSFNETYKKEISETRIVISDVIKNNDNKYKVL